MVYLCCLGTWDEEVRNKALISFQELERPTVMSLASEGWDATAFYFTFFESYKNLEQCLCLMRVPRCHHLGDFKGLKKRQDKVTLEGFCRGFGTSPGPALLVCAGLWQMDEMTYRWLLSHKAELLFSRCMLFLRRNGLFINDLPALMRHLGFFRCAKSPTLVPVPLNQGLLQAAHGKPFSPSSAMLHNTEMLWFPVAF